MSKRSYNQFCPLAYGLDVIGERWTLLIIRELLFGPRRYTDILNGLPGIGTNLLASRLKSLEDMGIVRQRTLPPPAASQVYELTELGDGLRPVIGAISSWGMHFLNFPPSEEDYLGIVPIMSAFRAFFRPAGANGLDATYEFRLEDTTLIMTIHDGQMTITEGIASTPDFSVQTTRRALVYVVSGEKSPDEAINNGEFIIIKGELPTFERLIPLFAFPKD